MKSKPIFLLLVLLVMCFVPQTFFVFAENEQIKIVADYVSVFEEPNINSNKIGTAFFGEKFDIISSTNEFYEITFEQTTGFIQKAYCNNNQTNPIEKTLDTNAVIIKDCNIFSNNNGELNQETILLTSGMRIKLLKAEENYSQIMVLLDNKTQTCWVESSAVNADGIPTKTVVAILLIITCVALFLILFSVYKNIKKKHA